jgi:crossover junction endodeoxyribonuclease RuvC
MIVLGIDPGLSITGWGLISAGQARGGARLDGRISLIEYGAIRTSPKNCLTDRLKTIHSSLQQIIKKNSPDVVAMEELFFLKRARTVAQVSQARGCILIAVAMNNIPVFEYNPRRVKIAITGYGSAEKRQIQFMVKGLLGLKEIPEPDDAADALAMAICHLNSVNWNNLVKVGTPHPDGSQ